MPRDYEEDKVDVFEQPLTVEQADAAIYGQVNVPDSGRVVARPIEIERIRADPRQPRRSIPASLQLHWTGAAAMVPDLLSTWHLVACKEADIEVSVAHVLQAWNDGYDGHEVSAPPIFREYVALLQLAQSIMREGLINPITVVEQLGGGYLIETGERRWLAYHVLRQYSGAEKWAKIPAVVADGRELEWRRARENTARRALNAIGMARQLALLIMDARRSDEQHYDDYDLIVQGGTCDRRFYAQVANGNLHPIPRGLGPRIQATMELSMSQISQHRNLLRLTQDDELNDMLWVRADVEGWSENAMRTIGTLTAVKVREVIFGGAAWTLDTLLELAKTMPAPEKPRGRQEMILSDGLNFGDAVIVKATEELGEARTGYWDEGILHISVRFYLPGGTEELVYPAEALLATGMSYEDYIAQELAYDNVDVDEGDYIESESEENETPQPVDYPFTRVRTPAGREGVLVEVQGRIAEIEYDDGNRTKVGFDKLVIVDSSSSRQATPPPGPLPAEQGGGDVRKLLLPDDTRKPITPFTPKETGTDNADSGTRAPDALNPIIRRDDPRRVVAQYLQGIAVAVGDDETQRALQFILATSRKAAGAMAAKGELITMTNRVYERISQAMIGWLEGQIAEMLNTIIETGEQLGVGDDESD